MVTKSIEEIIPVLFRVVFFRLTFGSPTFLKRQYRPASFVGFIIKHRRVKINRFKIGQTYWFG
ncbi:MAG: hypothetical protein A2Z42_00225 [Candidatus Woykebacteria bacterium RBG_19FT_COMBO_43_10]|uniref:Uncharacterized protein n=1 Tax=Candidatus Woykebacteria bacterium RBG_19FT_COMBO_43_10 TaxID=1802598 RepID=A0A1G1WI43_9BACT|nr:MAG: hypothetical protein A2Z42_00225 [Candidatus Woykebacteria bacterium RBG_19FT_COMBO_43_10]